MKNLYIFFAMVTVIAVASAQGDYYTAVNEEWSTYYSLPDSTENLQTTFDNSGNLIITGNTANNGATDIIIVCISPSGNILWQKQYDGPGSSYDYGTSVKIDNAENIIIAGRTYKNSTDDYNYVTLKYDKYGNFIWDRFYNGTGSQYDEARAISVDNQNNIFVTGKSKGIVTSDDYATVKYDSQGNSNWVSRYDYVALEDVPEAIVADNAGGVIVTGSSKSSASKSEYTTIKYNPNGQQTAINRHSLSSFGYDKATSIKRESGGTVYITGAAYDSSNANRNIKTIKFNSQLNPQWVKEYKGSNNDNSGNAIDLDVNGDVYITGHSTNSNGIKETVILKYAGNGTGQWIRKQPAPNDFENSEGQKIAATNQGDIYVIGKTINNNLSGFFTAKYNTQGVKEWEKYFKANSGSIDIPFDLKNIADEIFVTGKTTTGSIVKYVTVKYREFKRLIDPAFGNSGQPSYVKNEIIVGFHRNSMLQNSNNYSTKIQFGALNQFVKADVIDSMNNKTGSDMSQLKVVKVFPWLTPNDSISVSRLGDTVNVPDFWATFVIQLASNMQEKKTTDSLNTLQPMVYLADPNYISYPFYLPNDPLFSTNNPSISEQGGLWLTPLYPSAHININPAWDITTGSKNIKVGIYDSGINWNHEDFKFYGNQGLYVAFKAKHGWDFFSNTDIISNSNNDGIGHGTAVASIIGAVRNNGLGLAGIAGGTMQSLEVEGVDLYACNVSNFAGDEFVTDQALMFAVIKGCFSINEGGFGLNIINFSVGSNQSGGFTKMATHFANINNVTFVAASGNVDDETTKTTDTYPSSYNDEWVTKVGASVGNGTLGNFSVYGSGNNTMDVIAPGMYQLYAACDKDADTYSFNANGTSFSAPHVSGVAALMQSLHQSSNGFPNGLAHEDIERILEKTANNSNSYSQQAGYGKINAGNALQIINIPYQIKHFNNITTLSSNDLQLISSNIIILVPNDFYRSDMTPGIYIGHLFKVTKTFSYNLGSNNAIDAWVRNSSSDLLGIPHAVPWAGITVENFTNNSITLSGYIVFLVFNTIPGTPPVLKFYPRTPGEDIRWAYSLHLQQFPANIENEHPAKNISIFPNPTAGNIFIHSDNNPITNWELFSITGQLIAHSNKNMTPQKEIIIDISQFTVGIYFLKVNNSNFKIVKIH